MFKLRVSAALFLIMFLAALGPAYGQGQITAKAATPADLLAKKLQEDATTREENEVIGEFGKLPGPDAEAAAVLLDYLKEKERAEAWNITAALTNIMTAGQVEGWPKNISAYPERNAGSYLVPVLMSHADNSGALAWGKIFAGPNETVKWLDNVYPRLTDPDARGHFLAAISRVTKE